MSIASNVLSLNSNLTTARTNLKRLLENHGIVYHDDDNVFTLAKRAWFLVYPTNRISGGSYSEEAVVGEAVDLYVYMEDDDGNTLPDGCVADFYISVRGEPEIHMIGESVNGRAYCPYVPESSGDDIHVRAVVNDWEGLSTDIHVYPFRYEDSWTMDSDDYTLIKYPSSANVNVNVVDEFNSEYSYADGIEVSKTYGSSQSAYMIPTSLIEGVDLSETGIHFKAIVSPMMSSSSGWASGICLLGSKDLNHYRDTAILEVGAYPGKKGMQYSGSNHVVTAINTAS